MSLRVLDLFSGIGGFSLGLERTGGFKTVAFCEINEWCRQVLAKHWPNVPQMSDVTTIGVQPMSSSEDSPAKTSAKPEEAPALPGAVPTSGGSYAAPFAWYDRSTRSWRTWQRCLTGEWALYAETWPRSGMTRNGIAYRLRPLALPTGGIESGSWPTPDASVAQDGEKPETWLARREKVKKTAGNGNGMGMPLTIAVQLWPTPTSRDWKDGSAQACANVPVNGLLGRVVHQYATPQARDYRTGQASRWENPDRSRNLNDQIWWESEPDVGRVANGVPARVDRLKGLGNAVVPEIPHIIGKAILDYERGRK